MKIEIITPQFDRIEKLDFNWKPENDAEFHGIVKNAPWNILKGLGFRKWATMNECIKENQEYGPVRNVTLPTYDIDNVVKAITNDPTMKPEGEIELTLGDESAPTELLEQDEDIILFPHEWYDIIPDGFIVTGLSGEQYPFKEGESDDDKRFGCLPYGIRRKLNTELNE